MRCALRGSGASCFRQQRNELDRNYSRRAVRMSSATSERFCLNMLTDQIWLFIGGRGEMREESLRHDVWCLAPSRHNWSHQRRRIVSLKFRIVNVKRPINYNVKLSTENKYSVTAVSPFKPFANSSCCDDDTSLKCFCVKCFNFILIGKKFAP